MPDDWRTDTYRQRAAVWRERDTALAEGDDARASALDIAEKYENLARILAECERLVRGSEGDPAPGGAQ